jgi:hypothetical protein
VQPHSAVLTAWVAHPSSQNPPSAPQQNESSSHTLVAHGEQGPGNASPVTHSLCEQAQPFSHPGKPPAPAPPSPPDPADFTSPPHPLTNTAVAKMNKPTPQAIVIHES